MRKYALLVGVEEYRDKMISRLQFARADALALAELLRDRCGFHLVRVLADENGEDEPLLLNIVTALRDMAGELRQEDLFLFFFAGHGIEQDGHGYLLARDSMHMFPEHGALSLTLLQKTFGRLPASRRILMLDACRNSPEAGRGDEDNRLGDGLARDIVAVSRASGSEHATTCLLTACKSGQRAHEWPDKGHGAFTHFLLEGLDGGAWREGELDFESLAAYTYQETSRWSSVVGRAQIPWYEKFGSPVRLVLAAEPSPELTVAVGGSGQIPMASARVKCPQCGRRNDLDETFECRLCKRDFLCDRHWDAQQECCGECAAELHRRERDQGAPIHRPEDETADPTRDDASQGAAHASASTGAPQREDEPDYQLVGGHLECPHCDETFYTEEAGEVDCPKCSKWFTLDSDRKPVGVNVTCPLCDETFYTEEKVEVDCPLCSGVFTLNPDREPVGVKVTCPHCDETFYTEEEGEIECQECWGAFTIGRRR